MRNLGFDGRTCLDSPARKKDLRKAVGLYPCHNQGGNQVDNTFFFVYSKWQQPYLAWELRLFFLTFYVFGLCHYI